MTEREALKLALEALETAIHPWEKEKAITAIKEALAQPEQEPVLWVNPNLDKVSTDKKLAEKHGLYIPLCAALPHQPVSNTDELAQPEQEHVATSDTSEKRVDEMAKQRHEPEPVIDKSAATRIATALGWEPKRKPLEGVIDVQPIGYHSLQLIFRSQTDIAKFKAAHGIKE